MDQSDFYADAVEESAKVMASILLGISQAVVNNQGTLLDDSDLVTDDDD